MYRIAAMIALVLLTKSHPILAEESQESFHPTWKLLNTQEKQQFIAGYLQGWKDAAKVTDIAISYVKENPQKAVEGLQSVRALYEVSSLRPTEMAQQIDLFFSDAANHNASLSKAISFAKAQMR